MNYELWKFPYKFISIWNTDLLFSRFQCLSQCIPNSYCICLIFPHVFVLPSWSKAQQIWGKCNRKLLYWNTQKKKLNRRKFCLRGKTYKKRNQVPIHTTWNKQNFHRCFDWHWGVKKGAVWVACKIRWIERRISVLWICRVGQIRTFYR